MTRVDEFNNFYSSTSATALKATYAVCGDRQVAFDATVDAYRRAWRDWTKIRNHNPLGWVRNEAWKLTSLSRSTHPLRRRHEEDADVELLEALARAAGRRPPTHRAAHPRRSPTSRRRPARSASPPSRASRPSPASLGALERRLGQSLERDRGAHARARLRHPPARDARAADVIRHRAQLGRRRNTVLLVAAAWLLVLGGGFVVTEGDALETGADVPHREKIGSEGPDLVLQAQKIGTDDLLSCPRSSASTPTAPGRSSTPTTTPSPPLRTPPAPPSASPTATRSARSSAPTRSAARADERVAQAIEVSRNADQAEEAYLRHRPLVLRLRAPAGPARRLVRRAAAVRRLPHPAAALAPVARAHVHRRLQPLRHRHEHARARGRRRRPDPTSTTSPSRLNDSVAQVCKESGGTVHRRHRRRRHRSAPHVGGTRRSSASSTSRRSPTSTRCGPASSRSARRSTPRPPSATPRTSGQVGAVDPVTHLRHPGGARPPPGVRRGRDGRPVRVRRRRQGVRQGDREAHLRLPGRQPVRRGRPGAVHQVRRRLAARRGGSGSRSTRSRASTTAWPSCARAPTSPR